MIRQQIKNYLINVLSYLCPTDVLNLSAAAPGIGSDSVAIRAVTSGFFSYSSSRSQKLVPKHLLHYKYVVTHFFQIARSPRREKFTSCRLIRYRVWEGFRCGSKETCVTMRKTTVCAARVSEREEEGPAVGVPLTKPARLHHRLHHAVELLHQ